MKIILTLILVVILSSCDNSSGSGNSNNSSPNEQLSEFSKIPSNQLFKGNVCDESSGTTSARFYFTKLSSTTAISELDIFEKIGCESAVNQNVSFTIRQTVLATSEVPNSVDSSFKQITLVVQKYEAMPLTQEYVDVWNQAQYCGYTDWTIGAYKDTSNCQTTPVGSSWGFSFKFINNQILLFDGNYYE